jgi:hypothetical protein
VEHHENENKRNEIECSRIDYGKTRQITNGIYGEISVFIEKLIGKIK